MTHPQYPRGQDMGRILGERKLKIHHQDTIHPYHDAWHGSSHCGQEERPAFHASWKGTCYGQVRCSFEQGCTGAAWVQPNVDKQAMMEAFTSYIPTCPSGTMSDQGTASTVLVRSSAWVWLPTILVWVASASGSNAHESTGANFVGINNDFGVEGDVFAGDDLETYVIVQSNKKYCS